MLEIVFSKSSIVTTKTSSSPLKLILPTLLYTKLTLIWVGFLGFRFEVGEGGKITPRLKLVRIMLETLNLARKYTPICSFRKYTF